MQELESDSKNDVQCVCLSLTAFRWGRKTLCSVQRKHYRKAKTDGSIWSILSLVGVNTLLALCVDVEERREEPINYVYVIGARSGGKPSRCVLVPVPMWCSVGCVGSSAFRSLLLSWNHNIVVAIGEVEKNLQDRICCTCVGVANTGVGL